MNVLKVEGLAQVSEPSEQKSFTMMVEILPKPAVGFGLAGGENWLYW